MENYVKDYIIFIDTCSLLNSQSDLFWENIIPFLSKYGKKVIVPVCCIDEMRKIYYSRKNESFSQRAGDCLKKLRELLGDGFIEVLGNKEIKPSDISFVSLFEKLCVNCNLLLITQDIMLAENIRDINITDMYCVKTAKIAEDGSLAEYD
ncbi:MAG: hypothetical protein NC177_02645 [Ruminococcus flavefaciens]|nr:hypothetical protein [Ruminococcus flavefaciens]